MILAGGMDVEVGKSGGGRLVVLCMREVLQVVVGTFRGFFV